MAGSYKHLIIVRWGCVSLEQATYKETYFSKTLNLCVRDIIKV